MSLFELELIGGPWAKRLARRRAGIDALPWNEAAVGATPEERETARWVWTQSAFSEHASAAAFAQIASSLIAAEAPIDLVAAAGDFVADEVIHAELSARVAAAFGGAIALEVDPTRLVRPPLSERPLLRAAELVVRTSCVGEALTVPLLKVTKEHATSKVVRAVVSRIVKDESAHAQLGPWFLDWADSRLSDDDRAHLGRAAGTAVRAFAPIFGGSCTPGAIDCATYDATFATALARNVVRPLAACGIVIPAEDLAAVA